MRFFKMIVGKNGKYSKKHYLEVNADTFTDESCCADNVGLIVMRETMKVVDTVNAPLLMSCTNANIFNLEKEVINARSDNDNNVE